MLIHIINVTQTSNTEMTQLVVILTRFDSKKASFVFLSMLSAK